ncbi:MAG: ATP phosphoribosyltransferase [Terrimicrobiaceae bacterium]|jgi:ATP phosphoribosyltransferase|nr:ATP phosphoribosyltransferase [Terrimicrobiaceae bacterium]
MEENILTVGLPSGSLMEPTISLFAKAGFAIAGSSRSYRPAVDDPEMRVRLLRAQEISRYIEHGYLDCGITGRDWVEENESKIEEVVSLAYSKASSSPTRWVLVVPEDSPIRTVKDLEGKRVATEAVGITRRFFERAGVQAEVEFSWGATEVKVPDLVDAIVDITETGSSLRANKLRIVDTLMESYPALFASSQAFADPWKRQKIDTLALLLRGALAARDLVGLKMNLPEKSLKNLLEALPALRNPTVSPLAQPGWVAIETVIEEKVVREIVPKLKTLGAEGIIEYPLNKVVY